MRSLLAALLLLAALPAAAQHATMADALQSLGCSTVCVCEPTCPQKSCTPFDPSVPLFSGPGGAWNWLRYGRAVRPQNISDGTHSAGQQEAKALAEKHLVGRPLTAEEEADLSKVYCGSRSARATIIARFGESSGGETGGPEPPPCTPSGWTCAPMPELQAAGCREKTLHCTDGRLSASFSGCWRNAGTALGKVWLLYHRGVAGCDPWAVVEPPPPPPLPEPRCGDGDLDPGEDCDTCPADQPAGACEVEPPPPPSSGCDSALDAASAAWEVVLRECRP